MRLQAPAFSGTAVREGEFIEVSNKDYAGKWCVRPIFNLTWPTCAVTC